jgi:hypothetical protein
LAAGNAVKRLTLIRDETGDEGTFSTGMLTEGEQRLGWWNFIELPWRDNAPGLSCIPPGMYYAHIIVSSHFHRDVYLLEGIPNRDAIEMHPANFAGDATLGYHSDLKGCMAPGTGRGELMAPNGIKQKVVLSSAKALDELIAATMSEPIEIVISWEQGVGP